MRKTYVPGRGNPEAKLALVGEQPGLQEIQCVPPSPFVGPAGRGLEECLQMLRILRRDLWLTNVIKDLDMPLKHYIDINNRGQSTLHPEAHEYIQELKEELKKLPNLNCVLALGNVALLALTSRIGITKWRGSVLDSTLIPGLKVVPTFHPSTFIPPKMNFLNRPLIVEDIKKALYESSFHELRRRERSIITKPSFNRAVAILNHCYEAGCGGQTIGFDIEVINGEVDCFSLSWSPEHSICIPFRDQGGDYFTPDQEVEVLLLLAKILQDSRIAKAGANFIFDLQFMFLKYGIRPRGPFHCTQIAQKLIYPDYKAGLDFVTTMHTDVPYYKADGKKWMKMGTGSWEEWWRYNGMDAIIPVEAIPKQMETLSKQGNIPTYVRKCRLIEPLMYMSSKGIRVDVQGMLEYQKEQQSKLDDLAKELNETVGHDINYNSPAQVMNFFYKECHIKPYKKKGAGGKYTDTSDVDALKRIFRNQSNPEHARNAARLMLDIRGLSKRISTYLNVGKVDKDGRYRSAYKPVGAETTRLSSTETIFDTGGNQQNWPHDLLRFFLSDEGYIIYSIDLSQIENRIVAYVGGVIPQIRAFEEGIDLHRMTASVIFKKPYDQISAEDGSSELGDGRQSERYWGKKGNHAINYDVSYKTFGLKNEMPESEAYQIIEDIHRGYPQIRNGYHVLIQNMLKKNRTVINLFGRSRLFLGPVFPSHNVPKSACESTFREAYADLPQSTTAAKMDMHGINYVYYNQQWFSPIELLTQIHDALVFQVPLSVPWTVHAEMILKIKQSLEIPLEWHESEIQTPADLSMGLNMCKEDMKELKSKYIPGTPALLAEKLQEMYMELRDKNVRT